MFKNNLDRVCVFFIVIISVLLVFDLFFNKGHSAHMDGRVHITTITQFYTAMTQGEIKPTWFDGVANYGMPFGIVAHQLISYIGAFLTFLTDNVITSWKIIALMGAILSNVFFYAFLRIYFGPIPSLLAVFLYNVAPYRILNLYVREALPEFFASLFFPLIPLLLYLMIKKRKFYALPLLTVTMALFTLNHPMMLVVSSFFIAPYLLFLLKDEKEKLRYFILSGVLLGWGVLMAAYYVIPLQTEIKYFYYGLSANHLTAGQYLDVKNFIDPHWYYFLLSQGDIINRGHFVKVGVIELVAVLGGIVYLFLFRQKRKNIQHTFLMLVVALSVFTLFLTTKYSLFLYQHINLLSNIQFPWRMLSLFIFFPPIIYAYFFERYKAPLLVLLFIVVIAFARFPQLYSKNNTDHPTSRYLFTPINIHSTNMNTIWTGETEEYPRKKFKGEVIEGKGQILTSTIKNSRREYKIQADTEVRMADYTFYFPGWNVYIDGQKTTIEFQDPRYRGVITYKVPPGDHTVQVVFEDTKIRKYSNILSLLALGAFVVALLLERRFTLLHKILKYPKFI